MASTYKASAIGIAELPEVRVPRIDGIFDYPIRDYLADVFRDFLLGRRWFRSKARKVTSCRIQENIAVHGTDSSLVLVSIEYAEGDSDTYLFTVGISRGAMGATPDGVIIGRVVAEDGSSALLYDALWNRRFTAALLDAIGGDRSFEGKQGRLTACHTPALGRIAGTNHPDLPAKVSKAEQSNSSVFYGDRFILKLFRKLDGGVNPDFEIGRFLTQHGFEHTPAVAGHIEYRSAHGEPMSVGILQQFVPNRGDAWEYMLDCAFDSFGRAMARPQGPPSVPSNEHPMELMRVQPPPEAAGIIGECLESASILGERTAQLHIALSSGGGGPDFEPEPFNDEFRSQLHRRFLAQADTATRLVRDKLRDLSDGAAEDARRLLELEPRIRETFRQVCESRIQALRIRHHGDFHLGQVLYTGHDFMIIDFEGEPARPLEERRMKHAAMRDVAGMIRSFQYAAYSVLRKGQVGDRPAEQWAAFWTAWVSRAFAQSYFAAADGHAFLPQEAGERRLVFDVFLLEKALYEVAYELNNRPDWVGIPLRGIAALMA